jgi:hypothetical protein
MLGQIANYCPIISRNSIVKGSTSLSVIWNTIRQHFGFQRTGAHFLDLANVKLQLNEKPEDLYQRIMAFFEDNLSTADCGITHHGVAPVDEDLTPTLENTITVLWLQLVHPALPMLVKQRYATELRNKSLASLKPEISLALPSLLDEIRSLEDTKILRTAATGGDFRTSRFSKQRRQKSCILCKTAGRSCHNTHNLHECKFLPDADRRALGRSRLVVDGEDPDYESEPDDDTDTALIDEPSPSARRVNIVQSPYFNVFYKDNPVRLTLDCGATTNMIKASFAKAIHLPISPASQFARQADGVTPLDVVGEVRCTFTRDGHSFSLDALAVNQLDVDVLAGNPFMAQNDIATRPAEGYVVIAGKEVIHYGPQRHSSNASVRRTQAFLACAPDHQSVILPGDFVELSMPKESQPDANWAIEP